MFKPWPQYTDTHKQYKIHKTTRTVRSREDEIRNSPRNANPDPE